MFEFLEESSIFDKVYNIIMETLSKPKYAEKIDAVLTLAQDDIYEYMGNKALELTPRNLMSQKNRNYIQRMSEIIWLYAIRKMQNSDFYKYFVNDVYSETKKPITIEQKSKDFHYLRKQSGGIGTVERHKEFKHFLTIDPEPFSLNLYSENDVFYNPDVSLKDMLETTSKSIQISHLNLIQAELVRYISDQIAQHPENEYSGVFSVQKVLELCNKAQMNSESPYDIPVIFGTTASLSNIVPTEGTDNSNYMETYGMLKQWRGTKVLYLNDTKNETTGNPLLPQNTFYICAGLEKSINFVSFGSSYVFINDVTRNADATIEVIYHETVNAKIDDVEQNQKLFAYEVDV